MFTPKIGRRTLVERCAMEHTEKMYKAEHQPWVLSDSRRKEYASSSRRSQKARKEAVIRAAKEPEVPLTITYNPLDDMPKLPRNNLRALSLFSGGGGLDLGFDQAGFTHVASYDVLKFAGSTLTQNRPNWTVFSGDSGDVTKVDWKPYREKVDLIHGGPPCQPFSIAGRRRGSGDKRDMFPEFLRAVDEIRPPVFVAENVLGFLSTNFSSYREQLFKAVARRYQLSSFVLSAKDFGVPQDRRRAIIVGVRRDFNKTFDSDDISKSQNSRGVRSALGLIGTNIDGPAPTLRCTLTGPRQTTSIANSTASVAKWTEFGIWPHGVSPNRSIAASFPTKNQTYRLCVEECQTLQGFPLKWQFIGAVYQRLGLIGNSVCPPVGYALAKSIFDQIFMD
jgi:DNA (cytosine-5)-methyltransferase 1